MPEPSFFEQYDEGARPRGVPPRNLRRVVGAVVLASLLVIGLAGAAWFFVLKGDSKSSGELLNEALAAHVAGDLVKASELYGKILLDDPTNKFAHYNIGLIAQTQGRPEDAERSYRQALDSDPAYTPALFNLAIIRFEAGDFTESIDLYRQLIGITPDGASAHLNLGYALRADGQTAEGDKEIARAAELDPSLAAQAPPATGTTVDQSNQDVTTTTAG